MVELRAVARRSGGFFNDTRSPSKKTLRAAEQQRADAARARRRRMREQGLFDPARLVFDETSANTKMVRLHGRCARGERLVDLAPPGHWKTITFVAALRQNGMTAPCTTHGAMNGRRFLAYTLRHGLSRPASLAPVVTAEIEKFAVQLVGNHGTITRRPDLETCVRQFVDKYQHVMRVTYSGTVPTQKSSVGLTLSQQRRQPHNVDSDPSRLVLRQHLRLARLGIEGRDRGTV